MKVTQSLICLSLVPSFSVLAAAAQEENAVLVHAGLVDLLALTELLQPESKRAVQADLRVAAEVTLETEDEVLRVVYPELFRFGSALRTDVAAYSQLRQALTQSAESVSAEEFLEITERCAASEALLEQLVAEIKERLFSAIGSVAAKEKRDLEEVYKHYAPLADFLNALHTSLQVRMGQAQLIQERRALEAVLLQGNTGAEERIQSLNEKLQGIYSKLKEQDEQLLNTALAAYEARVLFRAVFSFISAVMQSEGAF
ncbi:hypothetical protein Esti_006681 [Eimeria stiedai]